MHTKLFEVAAAYVLQVPVIQTLSKRFSSDAALCILQEHFSFSPGEMAAICLDAYWRSLATIYYGTAESMSDELDERILGELRDAFSHVYLDSFASQYEQAQGGLSRWLQQSVEHCLQYLAEREALLAASLFRPLALESLLSPDDLPTPGLIGKLLADLLEGANPERTETIALLSHKKFLERTFLFFFRRRMQREEKLQRALSLLAERGLWCSMERPERAEEQLEQSLGQWLVELAQKEQQLQETLTSESQQGHFEEAQKLLSTMAALRDESQRIASAKEDVAQLVVESQVAWQSMAGGFLQFSERFGDLFEALHLSLSSPEELLLQELPSHSLPSKADPAGVRQEVEEHLVAAQPQEFGNTSSSHLLLPEASVSPGALPEVEAYIERKIAEGVEAYLSRHLAGLVDELVEQRWQLYLSTEVQSRADVQEETSGPEEPFFPSSAEALVTDVDVAVRERILSSNGEPQATPGIVTVEKQENSLEQTSWAEADEMPLSPSTEVPTIREFCFRLALEHRLWVEAQDGCFTMAMPGEAPLSEQGRAGLEQIAELRIHGRSRADKTQELLEEVIDMPLLLLTAEGGEASPEQSSKSLRIEGSKWAFALGARVFIVLKPGSKDTAPSPWEKYKVLTFGKALADFYEGATSRSIQLISARGIHQAYFDSAKHRFSRLKEFLEAYPELQDHDSVCLRQINADVFHCDVIFRDPHKRMESPEFSWNTAPPPPVSPSHGELPLLAVAAEAEGM